MQWISKHWVAIVVAIVSIGAGVGLAMISNNVELPAQNDEQNTNIVGELEVEEPFTYESAKVNATLKSGTLNIKIPVPSMSLPVQLPPDLVPWGTGDSDQTLPSSGGSNSSSLPSSETPWGTRPSQQ